MNISAVNVQARDYNRIFTGSNQAGGYENVFLGFTADTIELKLKADKSTYFHFPKSTVQIPLSSTDIINSGAFAGPIPFDSDRIYKKHAAYENDTNWGFSYPVNMQKGVWLCAWLSGNNDSTTTPIWMDRWYNPGYLDSTQSYYVSNSPAIYDEPSKMSFDPGVLYRYDHIGNTVNEQLVNMICGLAVHIDDWSGAIPIDTSGNGNDVTLYKYTSSMKIEGVNYSSDESSLGIGFNGVDQYGTILYDTSFNTVSDISYSMWIKSSDWQNQISHHFLSNGFRGGWSLGVNNGFFTPLIVLTDATGSVVFGNQTGVIYKDKTLPGTSSPVSIAVDSELYTWILDNGIYQGSKHLYKLEYNGNIESTVLFTSSIELRDLIIDKDNNAWVLTDQYQVSGFDSYCNYISSIPLNGTRLVINNANAITAANVHDICTFDDTNYWIIDNNKDLFYTLSGTHIPVLTGMSASNVAQSKDHTWVLFDSNKVAQYNIIVDPYTNETTVTQGVSTIIPDTIISAVTGRNIFFTNEIVNNVVSDYVWILQPNTEYLYKYDSSLNLLQKINVTFTQYTIQGNAAKGDNSGYNWHKLFNHSQLSSGASQIESSVYLRTNTEVLTSTKYTVSIPTTLLSDDGWHMFTCVIDNTENNMKMYVDSILRSTVSITPSSTIFYKYETPLTLGSNIGLINPIDDEIGNINRYYHNGSFDDLRIYTQPISIYDIRHINLAKYDIKDITWNMPIGTRSYIEEITKFFKFKMPGQKSQYYNIHLKGLQITNEDTRQIIEDIIKDTIQKIAPIFTSLYKIIWD